jgi:DNA-binding response OmpR family regulator
MAKKRLLIISDDPFTRDQLSQAFAASKFQPFMQPANTNVVFHLCLLQPDLVILEMRRSKDKGQKGWSFVPVIVLLPPGDVLGAVDALNAGADQCLSDAFVPQELQARARALLRRVEGAVVTSMQATPIPVL